MFSGEMLFYIFFLIAFKFFFGLSQTRPKVPPFSPPPPPPPSTKAPSESVYWEIESRPYLDILPEDNEEVIVRYCVSVSLFAYP